MKKLLKNIFKYFGYHIFNIKKNDPFIDINSEHEPEFRELYEKCKPFTMTTVETMFALYKSVEYIIKNDIPGDFAECGVWKGGSAMMMALMLQKAKRTGNKIYLYDTFEGMPEPGAFDKDFQDQHASVEWNQTTREQGKSSWCYAPVEEVKQNLAQTGYPAENLVFIKGKVEDTIPANLPRALALLRLDTDWYESTLCELEHLYPLLVKKGVLIIDDYGHWAGSRKATDEYFSKVSDPILLNRTDYSARVGVKI
jgi:O-methyltransferase